MKNLSDLEIWDLCVKGNKKAFEQLYLRYYELLYNYGMKIIDNRFIVSDTIQNLFINLITKYQRLSKTDFVKGYIILSFRNLLFDTLKKRDILSNYTEISDTFSISSLDDYFESEEIMLLQIKKSFQELSSRQQEILYLFYVRNLTHKEISVVLEINIQSSKNLLNRSIIMLKEKISKKGEHI